MQKYSSGNHDLLTSKLHALIEVAEVLAARLELPKLLQSVMDKIIEILEPAEFGIVLLWDPSTRLFRPQAVAGQGLVDLEPLFELGLQAGESITGRVYATQEAQLLGTPAAVAEVMANMQPANRILLDQIYGVGSASTQCDHCAIIRGGKQVRCIGVRDPPRSGFLFGKGMCRLFKPSRT